MTKKNVKKIKQVDVVSSTEASPVKASAPAAAKAEEKRPAKRGTKTSSPAESVAKSKTEALEKPKAVKTAKTAKKTKASAAASEPAAPAVEPVKVPGIHGPVKNGAETYLHPTDLSKIEMLQLRVKNSEQAAELASAKILAFQQDAAMKIQASKEDAQKLVKEYQAQRELLIDLYRKIEQAYGVDMKTFAYDSMTGRINPVPVSE